MTIEPALFTNFHDLGGTGLVGSQIVREMSREFPQIEFVGAWGNIFVRDALRMQPRHRLLEDLKNREKLYADLFGDIDATYTRSSLV